MVYNSCNIENMASANALQLEAAQRCTAFCAVLVNFVLRMGPVLFRSFRSKF